MLLLTGKVNMLFKRFIKSVNFAVEGIIHAVKTQRHLRYHFYSAAAILLISYILGVNRIEFLIISLSVIAILLAEMFNTAIETVVDIISPEHNEKAKVVKDIAAGAVFVTSIGIAVIGYIILMPYIRESFHKGLSIAKHTKEEVSIIALLIVFILVVITKSYFGTGRPLRGGMPSGHAACAFSAWVAITYITENFIVSISCFILALIIAQSRVLTKAHNQWEVILGSLIGTFVTFILFRIFS
jgi:diacylglycerol kinase (ATP)